jgi:YbbR domain-containing protein
MLFTGQNDSAGVSFSVISLTYFGRMIRTHMFKWLFRNLSTMALALILAVAVWVSAVTTADPDEVRLYPQSIPLEIVGQDPGLVITSPIPDKINLTLRAPRSVWDKLSASQDSVRAVMDLSGLSAGQHRITVQVQVRIRPVRVVSSSPETVDLTLEPIATKTFPIKLAIQGEIAVGYQAGTTRMDPKQVVISGPASLIGQVRIIQADLSIAGVRQDIQTSLPLRVLGENGALVSGLSVNPEKVSVQIPVTQQGGYRDIAVKVLVYGQVAGGYRLTNISVFPPILTVYSTEPSLVNALPGFVETQPLNLNGASQDIETKLGLNLPAGISAVGEQTVQVQVGIAAIEGSLSLNDMKVETTGLADGLQAHISPENVDVIVTGPLPLLDKLSAGDVKIIVDLTGLTAGMHQLTPQAQIIINDVQIQSINPATIEVIISTAGTEPTVKP